MQTNKFHDLGKFLLHRVLCKMLAKVGSSTK